MDTHQDIKAYNTCLNQVYNLLLKITKHNMHKTNAAYSSSVSMFAILVLFPTKCLTAYYILVLCKHLIIFIFSLSFFIVQGKVVQENDHV